MNKSKKDTNVGKHKKIDLHKSGNDVKNKSEKKKVTYDASTSKGSKEGKLKAKSKPKIKKKHTKGNVSSDGGISMAPGSSWSGGDSSDAS